MAGFSFKELNVRFKTGPRLRQADYKRESEEFSGEFLLHLFPAQMHTNTHAVGSVVLNAVIVALRCSKLSERFEDFWGRLRAKAGGRLTLLPQI
jgi:hypothetical protein